MFAKPPAVSAFIALTFLTQACVAPAQRLPASVTPSYTFRPVRIVAGGYIPDIIAHPTQPGLFYARTDIGSVYRWSTASNSWVPLTDFQSPANYNLNGPESIALDPTDPNRLYIAAGMYTYTGAPYAMLVSTDQGATFSTYRVPFAMAANNNGRAAGERLAVNPFKPSELMMGTRRDGLWVSEDYAQTWSRVSSFPVASSTDGFGLQWVLFDPKNSGTVYVGSYTTSTIYRSTDGGTTWAALPGEPASWPFSVPGGTHAPAPERALLNADGSLYVNLTDLPGPDSMNFGIVEKFDPVANTWTNITPPLDTADGETTPRGGFAGLTQDPSHPGTVAVSTFDRWYPVDTVYLTRDGGQNWIDLAKTTSSNGGVDGPPYGNFYFNPSVFTPISPWLTFGNTSSPHSPVPTARFGWWLSGVLIDPTNPDHLMFATGATLYATDNLSAADSGKAPTWYVQGLGIEETAVLALISPTQGAHLLSGVGDIGGFRHDDFNVSPQGGMFTNPVATSVSHLDWAGQSPGVIVRTQSPNTAGTSPCTYGAYSSDGGTSWSPFPSCATGASSGDGGPIAVDAAGTTIVWSPTGASRPQYSTDSGKSWTAVNGLPGNAIAVADKVTPATFYAVVGSDLYSSTSSSGHTFTKVSTSAVPGAAGCSTSVCGFPVLNWAKAGDIWLPLGTNGLYHSADGGVTWTHVANVSGATSVALGAPAPKSTTSSVFLYGTAAPANVAAIYRSDDNGANWVRINDDRHQYGGPTLIQADPRVYGRVYLGMNGRGIIYGDLANAAELRRPAH